MVKRLDIFTKIDSDVSRGQKVSKTWDEENYLTQQKAIKEQEAMNLIDIVEQRLNGKIKPMSEQFPGEIKETKERDVFESDK